MQKIPCVPIFRKKLTILPFLAQICPKRHLGLGIEKTNAEIRISILKIPCVPIFKQNGQLWLFEPKFTQKWILWLEFQKLSLDSESAPSRYHVSQFSVKMDNFEFFGLNLGKLPNYVRYFCSNIAQSVAESWVEAVSNTHI